MYTLGVCMHYITCLAAIRWMDLCFVYGHNIFCAYSRIRTSQIEYIILRGMTHIWLLCNQTLRIILLRTYAYIRVNHTLQYCTTLVICINPCAKKMVPLTVCCPKLALNYHKPSAPRIKRLYFCSTLHWFSTCTFFVRLLHHLFSTWEHT